MRQPNQSNPQNRPPSSQEPGFLRTLWEYLTKPSFAKAGLTLLSVVGLGYASQYVEGVGAMFLQGAASFFALMLFFQLTRCCCCCWGNDPNKNTTDASNSPANFPQGYNQGFQAGVHFAASQQQQSQFHSTYATQPGMTGVGNTPIPMNSNNNFNNLQPSPPPPPTAPPLPLSSALVPSDTDNQTEGYQPS